MFYFCKPGAWLRIPPTLNFGGKGYPEHIMKVEQYCFLLRSPSVVFLWTLFKMPSTGWLVLSCMMH